MSTSSPARPFLTGALFGSAAWLAYAAAELAFVAIVPRLFPTKLIFRHLHHDFSLLLLPAYAAGGAVLGALAASVLRTRSAPQTRSAALATVSLAMAVHLLLEFGSRPSVLPLAVTALAAGLTVLLIVAAVSGAWGPRLRFVANPATVAVLLAGPPWILKDLLKVHQPTSVRAGAALAFCAAVIVISFVVHRARRHGPAAPGAARAGKTIATAAAAATAVATVSLAVNRLPGPDVASVAVPRPHPVVLVILDTVRADHMSVYGYAHDTTPRLREFAKDAMVYSRAVAAGDMTLSTHASLFTGKYPREHGAHHPDPDGEREAGAPSALSDRFETLAETLAERGYRTGGVVANHGYLGPFFRLHQGFQYWDSRPAASWTSAGYYLRSGIRRLFSAVPRSPSEGYRAFRSADEINEETFALLDRWRARPGFLLFVNYMDAHFPYVPPPPFDTMFPGSDHSLGVDALDRKRRDFILRGAELTETEQRHLLSQYDGGIAYVDSRFGDLVDRLKQAGVYEDALVIVTSDHGEAFGRRGFIDHGTSVYQDQVYVPLLIKYPDTAATGATNDPVNSVDILPTVLSVLGLDVPEGVRGRSLLGDADGRPVIAEHYPVEAFAREDARYATVERALFGDRYKLIRSSSGAVELFDLDTDPDEEHDLYRSPPPAIALDLQAQLDAWLEATEVAAPVAGGPDDEVNEQLEALGYVQ